MAKRFYGEINLTVCGQLRDKFHTFETHKGNNVFENKALKCDLWINDEPDAYGNQASLVFSEKQEDGTYKKTYLGNFKLSQFQPQGEQSAPQAEAPQVHKAMSSQEQQAILSMLGPGFEPVNEPNSGTPAQQVDMMKATVKKSKQPEPENDLPF